MNYIFSAGAGMGSAGCLVCGGRDLSEVVEIKRVPVFCNVLWASRQDALKAERGDIRLLACGDCGHVFNAAFDAERLAYSGEYDNSLHFSEVFDGYARGLAERLIAAHGLRGKDIIEIGCGKGNFLKMLCEMGVNRGVGFDPSYEGEDGGRVRFVKDYYGKKYAAAKGDFVCCRHVLEHVEGCREFVRGAAEAAGDDGGVVYFEVPNARYSFECGGVWDLIYEHVSYFGERSLRRLFEDCGFGGAAVREEFGGQFLGIEAVKGRRAEDKRAVLADAAASVKGFAKRYEAAVRYWRERVGEFEREGKKTVVWGAGSKGVSFVNAVDDGGGIRYLVDVNPAKRGRYVGGSGQKVVGPDELKEAGADVVIVMNGQYMGEIGECLRRLGLRAEVVDVNDAANKIASLRSQ